MRGHIRQRSKGTWTLVVYTGQDPDTGKKRYKWETVRGTKKQAEAELAKLVREVETGTDLEPGRSTMAGFLHRWLEASRSRVGVRTWERYEELIRLHVLPALGPIQLSKLRPLHLERLYLKLLVAGLSARTVLHVHRVLHAALAQGVKWQLVSSNVSDAVITPRPNSREVDALEPDEAAQLIKSVEGTPMEVPVLLALGAGLRRGEVLGLHWRDVDLEDGRIRIKQSLQATKEGLQFLPPKTHRSNRSMAIPSFVIEGLVRQRNSQDERQTLLGEAWRETDLVVDRGNGEPMSPHALSHQFRAASTKAGLDLNFHGLRHAHASLMLAGGVHLKVVSDRLGHSTIGITADLYSHVAPVIEQQAAATLDRLISGGQAAQSGLPGSSTSP